MFKTRAIITHYHCSVFYVCTYNLTFLFYNCNSYRFLFYNILILYHIFQAFFAYFSVILRISQNQNTKTILTTFVYDTFAQKNLQSFLLLWRLKFTLSNYLITTSFQASDGTIAMYVLPTFNTNSLPLASKYCVGLVSAPFVHLISIISPFTR